MTLTISDRDSLLKSFLIPISKVTDSVVLQITAKQIVALISTTDNTIIVNATYKDENINISQTLNVPDLKKLCRILECIDTNTFDLDISTNSISYSSNAVRFKYHLYDDNIISIPKINLAKLEKLEFDGTFNLTHASLISLIRGSSIATDTNKIYISVKGNELFGDLTDKSRANTDSYGLKISDDYAGTSFNTHIPLNFEIFRIISSIKFDNIKGKIVTSMGVITFNIATDKTQITFIISALAN